MKTGTIILIPFPYSELTNIKVPPAVVIAETADKFKDLIIFAISSVVPQPTSRNEIIIQPTPLNNLRCVSVIKVDRIMTIKQSLIIEKLGE